MATFHYVLIHANVCPATVCDGIELRLADAMRHDVLVWSQDGWAEFGGEECRDCLRADG